MKTAFLGLGRMGSLMARHVLDGGHDLTVWNRTPGRADDLVAAGAVEAASAAGACSGVEAVVLMLFGPESVREVLPAIVDAAAPGALVLDSTTISPAAAREFAATARGLRYLDTPVAGSLGPARDGTLGVFAGGPGDAFDEAMALLHLWGDPARVRHVGPVGSASALKLCVNQGIGVLAAGLGETMRLGRDLGLDRDLLLDVLGATAYGWVMGQKRAMLDTSDYTGTTFSLDLLAKDLGLALTAAGADGADLAVTRAALSQAEAALRAGHAGEDYAAVIGHLADEGSADSQ